MAIHNKYFSVQNTPNTVSMDRSPDERAYANMVFESGKPPIDYEFNISQDLENYFQRVLASKSFPSGFLKGQTRADSYADYSFDAPSDPTWLANSFHLNKVVAHVAGLPVVVEYTNSDVEGDNIIQLNSPPVLGGAPPDVKRTDFVFLEVWKSLVAPSPRATADITVASLPNALDTITITHPTPGALALTATAGAPGVDEFQIGVSEIATAANIALAINDAGNSFSAYVVANSMGTDKVYLYAQEGGTAGNLIALTSSVLGVLVPSGALFTGGSSRPNKPTQNTIYRHGNTLAPAAVNLAEDLVVPLLGVETTQRVQIQYRIRATGATESINHKTEPNGFSNANLLAQGGEASPVATYRFVPADKTTVSGGSSAVAYGIEDSGLWIAGDGSSTSATDLQTLDGFVYAIPICFAFRRNDAYAAGAGAGFDPINNTNGGLTYNHALFVNPYVGNIATQTSDRPDNGFVDVIVDTDILDLRRHVALSGIDLQSELQHQMKSLMDGNFRTWAIDASSKQTLGSGSGDVSTKFLVCNEIGRDSGHGGNNITSGDTGRGVTVRNFDHVARRFADQPVVERLVLSFYPQDRESGAPAAPGLVNPGKFVVKNPLAPGDAGWYVGDTININLTNLNCSTDGTWCFATASLASAYFMDFAPPGTTITDVLSIYHDDGNYYGAVDQRLQAAAIMGLGTGHIEIMLDENPLSVNGGLPLPVVAYPTVGSGGVDDGSPRRVFVELEITYPLGVGITDTPDLEITPNSTNYDFGPMFENNLSQRPADMEGPLNPFFRSGYREVNLEYIASENGGGAPIGSIVTEEFVSRDATTLVFPRRVYGSLAAPVTVTEISTTAVRTVSPSTSDYGSSSRQILLGPAGVPGGVQSLMSVTYYAQEAVPNYGAAGGGYQVSFYYRSNAPQTGGVKEGIIYEPTGALPVTLRVEPLLMSQNLWTGQCGMGTMDLSFPYYAPLDQIPVNDNATSTFYGEWQFSAPAEISISDFDAETGLLNLHCMVPSDESTDFEFGGALHPPKVDAEFRAFYDFADDQTYRPTALAQPLSGAVRHKVFMPFLARAKENCTLYRKNEILLIVLTRWAEKDKENSIKFTDTDNRSCAALYRTKRLLIVAD